ncbi:MAG TPA: VWA domain-containing protein [Bryobacteraceae bacterium]|nr:VWA domain-containing protein [Bryobacteraceae bacterium]
MYLRVACLFAAAVCAWASDLPQRLVTLNAVATDAKGNPVGDLSAADIRVRDQGKPQAPVFFRFSGIKSPIAPPGPGEYINRPALPPTLILFDRWNERLTTAASAWNDITSTLQHMESVERIYIYFLTNHGTLYPVHPLPDTKADLREANPPTPAELVSRLGDAVRKLQGFRDVDVQDPVYRARVTLEALDTLGTQMSVIAGRKNLMWVTHGFPLTVRVLPANDWVDFTPQIWNFSAAADRSQIAVYTVDQSAQGAGADPNGAARPTLELFASLTGGRWYGSGNTERALGEAISDARGSYRLAYNAPIQAKDRKEHKIHLESDRKGLHLLTREGYFGNEIEPDPGEMQDDALKNARRCPFDATEIGLRVTTSRKPGADNMHLSIRINPADVFLEPHDDTYQGSLAMMLVFYSHGMLKRASDSIQADLNFTKEQLGSVQKDGIVIPQDVPVSDDIQTMRVIVYDRGIGSVGSVTIPMPVK